MLTIDNKMLCQQATKENNQAIVNASFHVTQWNVSPFGTGLSRLKNQQCVFGGDVLRYGVRLIIILISFVRNCV